MIHESIQSKLPEMMEIFKRHHIKNAFLFGSVLTDEFKNESDVDILVNILEGQDPEKAGEHLWDLGYDLEDLLHRKVEIVTEWSLKNKYFIPELNKTKLAIYG